MTLTPLRDDRRLGPVRDELKELGPLAEVAVVEWLLGLQEPPKWARVLGPWQPYLQARSLARFEVGRDAVGANVWPKDDGSGWVYWSSRGHRQVGPFETRSAAMNAADAEAITEGYLHDNVRPLEEAPPAAAPAPAHEVGPGRLRGLTPEDDEAAAREAPPDPQPITPGPGRRAGQHRWQHVELIEYSSWRDVWLDRCEGCGLWRAWRSYAPATYTQEEAQLVLARRQGSARAGRCPGRQP